MTSLGQKNAVGAHLAAEKLQILVDVAILHDGKAENDRITGVDFWSSLVKGNSLP